MIPYAAAYYVAGVATMVVATALRQKLTQNNKREPPGIRGKRTSAHGIHKPRGRDRLAEKKLQRALRAHAKLKSRAPAYCSSPDLITTGEHTCRAVEDNRDSVESAAGFAMTTVGDEGTDDEFTGDDFVMVAMDMNDPVDNLGDEIDGPQNYHTSPAAMRTDWIVSAPLVPIAKGVGARPIKFSLFPPRKPHTNRLVILDSETPIPKPTNKRKPLARGRLKTTYKKMRALQPPPKVDFVFAKPAPVITKVSSDPPSTPAPVLRTGTDLSGSRSGDSEAFTVKSAKVEELPSDTESTGDIKKEKPTPADTTAGVKFAGFKGFSATPAKPNADGREGTSTFNGKAATNSLALPVGISFGGGVSGLPKNGTADHKSETESIEKSFASKFPNLPAPAFGKPSPSTSDTKEQAKDKDTSATGFSITGNGAGTGSPPVKFAGFTSSKLSDTSKPAATAAPVNPLHGDGKAANDLFAGFKGFGSAAPAQPSVNGTGAGPKDTGAGADTSTTRPSYTFNIPPEPSATSSSFDISKLGKIPFGSTSTDQKGTADGPTTSATALPSAAGAGAGAGAGSEPSKKPLFAGFGSVTSDVGAAHAPNDSGSGAKTGGLFGAPASTTSGAPPMFGSTATTEKAGKKSTEQSTPSFTFGGSNPAQSATANAGGASTFAFGSNKNSPVLPTVTFGGTTKPASTSSGSQLKQGVSFAGSTTNTKPAFGSDAGTGARATAGAGLTPSSALPGNPPTSTSPIFGNAPGPNLFGGSSGPSPSFGTATTGASPSLGFGSTASTTNTAPPATNASTATGAFGSVGTFGSNNSNLSSATTGAPVFGSVGTSLPSTAANTEPPASVFGASQSPASGAGDKTLPVPAFGTTSTNTPAFGSTAAAPAFGSNAPTPGFGAATPAPAFGATATASVFGASSTSPAFGATAAPNPTFGTTTSGGFGSSTASPAFGSSTSTAPAFGANATTSATPAFSVTAAPAFGTSAATGFGASTAPVPSFGATNAPGFGTSASPATGFGAAAAPVSGFGSTSGPVTGSTGAGGFGGFGLSATAQSPAPAPASAGFNFGAVQPDKPAAFAFGGPTPGGSTTGTGQPFTFGGGSTSGSAGAAPAAPAGTFAFGSQPAAQTAPGMAFGGPYGNTQGGMPPANRPMARARKTKIRPV